MLSAAEAFWRPSNQMGVQNTDLAKQLEARSMGARLWRLAPGQASTRHRHFAQEELYVLLEGRGRIRVDDELLTLGPLDALLVEPESVRQPFNDTDADQLWLVVGAPPEGANTLEMSEEQLKSPLPRRAKGAAAGALRSQKPGRRGSAPAKRRTPPELPQPRPRSAARRKRQPPPSLAQRVADATPLEALHMPFGPLVPARPEGA